MSSRRREATARAMGKAMADAKDRHIRHSLSGHNETRDPKCYDCQGLTIEETDAADEAWMRQ